MPSFDEEGAFVSYPPLANVHHELRLEVEFLPLAPDGLLLFSAGKAAPVEDFVALAMIGGHLEFRYELGSGGWHRALWRGGTGVRGNKGVTWRYQSSLA